MRNPSSHTTRTAKAIHQKHLHRETSTEKDQGQKQNEQNGNHNVNLLPFY
ncbi:hypothetical protein SHIRM173S_12699 [Streptomyces hirsutus]